MIFLAGHEVHGSDDDYYLAADTDGGDGAGRSPLKRFQFSEWFAGIQANQSHDAERIETPTHRDVVIDPHLERQLPLVSHGRREIAALLHRRRKEERDNDPNEKHADQ